MSKHCSDCRWVQRFTPRRDEIVRGLTSGLGCGYPCYEGYTSDEQPLCGGVSFEQCAADVVREP